MKIGVLGGGSWATALVKLLCSPDSKVYWWMRNQDAIDHIQQFGHNPNYIQSIEFDLDQLVVTSDLQAVVDYCDYLVVAIPSAFLHVTMDQYKPKGIENKIIFPL